ncbi:MAG TPA: hypothetical protein DD473_02350 [Planctomycetaceae bacterium]|nr:hypothetical protein [Planctomycetaceae bacterium]
MDFLTILATIVFTIFAFGYGACFGSFLNVVVWRLPRHMPILLARSHCPKCKQDIKSTDNIPIFGWLRLRGKCRNCHLPISPRYPLVETGVALLFAVLFLLIVVAHGVTLPASNLTDHRGNWLSEFPGCPLLYVYLHQITLGYFLLSLALIDEDHQKSPWTWTLFGLMLHGFWMLIEPSVGQLDFLAATQEPLQQSQGTLSQAGLLSFLGLTFAGLFSLIFRWLKVPHQFTNCSQSMILLGVFLGPVVLCWSTMMMSVSMFVQWNTKRMLPQKNKSSSGAPLQIFLTWLLIICTWRWWPMIDWGKM